MPITTVRTRWPLSWGQDNVYHIGLRVTDDEGAQGSIEKEIVIPGSPSGKANFIIANNTSWGNNPQDAEEELRAIVEIDAWMRTLDQESRPLSWLNSPEISYLSGLLYDS